jgi:hypothetical protein
MVSRGITPAVVDQIAYDVGASGMTRVWRAARERASRCSFFNVGVFDGTPGAVAGRSLTRMAPGLLKGSPLFNDHFGQGDSP